MKALIRNPGETVRESDGIPAIDWNTGMPLTDPHRYGGPYRLVADYVASADDQDIVVTQPDPDTDFDEDPVQDTIVIDGVTYTRTS